MTSDEMKIPIDPTRAKSLVEAVQGVSHRVDVAAGGRRNVRLVAVSKLKPASDIWALHEATESKQSHFGENYAQELMEKAEVLPKSIKWHFIGGLQSNKCKSLASSIPNLFLVSSVDSAKKATLLSQGRTSLLSSHPNLPPLNIHIQLNTSSEASKSGVTPGPDTLSLAKHIISACPSLHLLGLMTIGAIARSKGEERNEKGENEDFRILMEERKSLEGELGKWVEEDGEGKGLEWGVEGEGGKRKLECSMGMSEDFEEAIAMGSDEVRVGSTIFGVRPPKEEFRVKGEVEDGKQ